MIATFTALLAAHVLADFAFQTKWMAANKRRFPVLALHGATVLVTTMALTGQLLAWPVFMLALLHLLIDDAKTRSGQAGVAAFLVDQAAHLVTVLGIAAWAPGLWSGGAWGAMPAAAQLLTLQALTLIAGALLATRAGGFAIDMFMKAHLATQPPGDLPDGLPGGGMIIGLLERGLIFLMITANQAAAIGFLIAAKSVLRFGAASEDRKASEYVIIGTLASFGWAIAASLGTVELLHRLLAAAP